ncbi:MAG TPA: hypothetical protein VLC12_03575 [Terriglobales bacterium]|nr:hypothetical protein [Terriglobales bacterium]
MARTHILGGILLLLAAGCGGGSWDGSHARFVNRTGMAEAEFQALAEQKWAQAQSELATQAFDLHAAVPEQGALVVPADARSLQVAPRNVVVEGETDVAAAALNHLPDCVNCPYRDPTGLIHCRVGFCQAYLRDLCTIVVPVSRPGNMGPYEMENCILWSLGYDVSGR